jgi:hypothetical protein
MQGQAYADMRLAAAAGVRPLTEQTTPLQPQQQKQQLLQQGLQLSPLLGGSQPAVVSSPARPAMMTAEQLEARMRAGMSTPAAPAAPSPSVIGGECSGRTQQHHAHVSSCTPLLGSVCWCGARDLYLASWLAAMA